MELSDSFLSLLNCTLLPLLSFNFYEYDGLAKQKNVWITSWLQWKSLPSEICIVAYFKIDCSILRGTKPSYRIWWWIWYYSQVIGTEKGFPFAFSRRRRHQIFTSDNIWRRAKFLPAMAKCHTRTTTQHYHLSATRAVNSVDPGRVDEEIVSPSGLAGAATAENPSIKVVDETSPSNTREISSSNDTDFVTASKSLNSLDVRSSFSSSSIGETESQSDMPCVW